MSLILVLETEDHVTFTASSLSQDPTSNNTNTPLVCHSPKEALQPELTATEQAYEGCSHFSHLPTLPSLCSV